MFNFKQTLTVWVVVGGCSIWFVDAGTTMPNGGLIMRESSKMPAIPEHQPLLSADPLIIRRPMPASNSLRVNARSFGFYGNRAFRNDVLQSLLANYIGHELTFADLQAAASIIKNYYQAAGFSLVEVYVPEQTLEQGQVDLMILEEGYEDNGPEP